MHCFQPQPHIHFLYTENKEAQPASAERNKPARSAANIPDGIPHTMTRSHRCVTTSEGDGGGAPGARRHRSTSLQLAESSGRHYPAATLVSPISAIGASSYLHSNRSYSHSAEKCHTISALFVSSLPGIHETFTSVTHWH